MGAANDPTLLCLYCGGPMPQEVVPGQKYCKPSHRTLAYRARTRARMGAESGLATAGTESAPRSSSAAAAADEVPQPHNLPGLAPADPVARSVPSEPSSLAMERALGHELAALQQRLASCQAELAQVHAAAQDAQAQGSPREQQLRNELAQARRQQAERETELMQACSAAAAARDQAVNREQQTLQDRTTEQAELQARLTEHQAAVDQLQKQRDHHVAQLATICNRVNALEAEQQKWATEKRQWSQTEAELRRQLAQATDRNTAVEAQVRTLEQDRADSAHLWTEQCTGMYQRITYLQQRLWLVAGLPREAPTGVSAKPKADAAGPQTLESTNPLIPFVRKVLEHLAQVSLPPVRNALTEHEGPLQYLGLLIAQAQLVALLVPAWGPPVGKKPNQLAQCVVQIVRAHPELYPLLIPDCAEQQEELLVLFACQCKDLMRLQLLQTSWNL